MNLPALDLSHIMPAPAEKFMQDAIDLFSGTESGHIGKWYYGHTKEKGVSASGEDLWTQLSEGDQQHTVASGEELALAAYLQADAAEDFKNIRHFIELGPGTPHAVDHKTSRLVGLAHL